jgi:hypothetical protein
MVSNDRECLLVEKVARRRAEEALKEIREHYPEATVEIEVRGGRGILTACQDRFVLSKEFIETEESLCSPRRVSEYSRIYARKSSLGPDSAQGKCDQDVLTYAGVQSMVTVLLSDLLLR